MDQTSRFLLPEVTELSCRFCLAGCSVLDSSVTLEAREEYKECTGFIVKDVDIPTKICASCKSLLRAFFRFRRKAIEVEAYLAQVPIKREPDLDEVEDVSVSEFSIPESPVPYLVQSLVQATFDEGKGESVSSKSVSKENSKRNRLAPHENAMQCSKCHRSFQNFDERKLHLETVHKDHNLMFCDICKDNRGFFAKQHIHNHMKAYHFQKLPCPECGKLFGPRRMDAHRKRIHCTDTNIICQLCGQGFAMKQQFKDHMLFNHTKEEEWKYECKYCKKKVNKFKT